jgi:TfoX/Sxy family transcriptional regulator of competence genes
MAHNGKLTLWIREALSNIPNVEEKKMFRGLAFMVNGKMCVTVADHEIMCRIDPAVHNDAIEKKGCRTVIMKGREYLGWVLVGEEGLKSKKELYNWIKLALDYNKYAKAAPKRKKE